MVKISEELLGLRVNNDLTINQVYFDETLDRVTYVEINKYQKPKERNLEPDHHAGDVLNSIQASGGQYTHDNYPVTGDDLNASDEVESFIVPYSSLSWEGSNPVISDRGEDLKPTVLADQYSYHLLCKGEVHTEDGQKLGKVNDVTINKEGKVEGIELSEGFLSDFLMSGQPYMKVNESVRIVEGNVIVPENFQEELTK
ncbi:PRC-barrel domain-containing protein [Guptibacillus algicola]|uniref:PRC-barrel domain-containing protein n=1 Tax=Guptibacillus algicola TaxID=225844 RepID=UPI001CD4E15F|nr:PRC-barrel domain-containing protein [Alkalihalobacillus algicola]MCA0986417.1 PRC-barrel domain-containing protein [Alkalihalobacillus algicola]